MPGAVSGIENSANRFYDASRSKAVMHEVYMPIRNKEAVSRHLSAYSKKAWSLSGTVPPEYSLSHDGMFF